MIKINDTYFMENDSTCLTLYKRTVVKSGKTAGKEKLDAVGYFNSGRYDQLFVRLSEIGTSNLDSFDDILTYYKTLKKDILAIFNKNTQKEVAEFLKKSHTDNVEADLGVENGSDDRLQGEADSRKITWLSQPLYDMPLKKWHTIATRIKRRDGFKCRRCKNDVSSLLTVHHIHSRENGGTDEDRNLLTLCKDCHNYIELHEIVNWDELTRVA